MDRAGYGEFDTEDRFYTRSNLQTRFLHRAAQLVPELKPSLARVVETLPKDWFVGLEAPKYSRDISMTDYNSDTACFSDELAARTAEVCTAIRRWREHWQMFDQWVGEVVSSALVPALHHPGGREAMSATKRVDLAWLVLAPFDRDSPVHPPTDLFLANGSHWMSLITPQPDDFVFSARWYPTLEYRSDIARWLKDRFDAELNTYLDATEAKMEAAGLVRSPEKRAGKGGGPMQHFDWLIRSQLDKQTHEKIAKAAGVRTKTVAAGCKSASELIDLTRRTLR